MSVLLDTNVISELARPRPDGRVIAFCRKQTTAFLSVVTLHELVFGAERVKDGTKRRELLAWIETIEQSYGNCVIPITLEIARHAGRLRAAEARKGRVLHIEDALIASTAIIRSADLATRNVRDFEPLGVRLINPWSPQSIG